MFFFPYEELKILMFLTFICYARGLLKTKLSHLDIVGRPVIVLEKTNVVAEHNQYFQVFFSYLVTQIHLLCCSSRKEQKYMYRAVASLKIIVPYS